MPTGLTTCDRYAQRCSLSLIGRNNALKSGHHRNGGHIAAVAACPAQNAGGRRWPGQVEDDLVAAIRLLPDPAQPRRLAQFHGHPA